MVFKCKRTNPMLAKVVVQRAMKFFFYAYSPKTPTHLAVKLIRGEKLAHGWVKLNTDESSLGNPRPVGGGVIRDIEGAWIMGFVRNIGITSRYIVELWALWDELLLCINRNFNAIEVELDAKSIIDVLSTSNCSNSLASPLVDDYRLLATQIHQIRFKHYF